jgi:hypothetical protein
MAKISAILIFSIDDHQAKLHQFSNFPIFSTPQPFNPSTFTKWLKYC